MSASRARKPPEKEVSINAERARKTERDEKVPGCGNSVTRKSGRRRSRGGSQAETTQQTQTMRPRDAAVKGSRQSGSES